MKRMVIKGNSRITLLAPVALALGLAGGAANALDLSGYGFQSGFTASSTDASIINQAISAVSSLYSNNLSVNILFNGDSTLGGGASSLTTLYTSS
jgi:hypothetical protein